ncbi:hypothetical protein R3P38DRAFT_3166050 [Favolaschia claudopus]|uniref:Uncharacterized protein n=1 Tax=Favolaschia claudopus TaxID=2862362 RepID=A0AAW0EJN5_9AGAR
MDLTSSTIAAAGHDSQSLEKLIKSLIAASEEKIARIDSQIQDLICMRNREYGLLATLKPVIAPIRKLSDELLMDIFHRAIYMRWN